ncbi:probable receptor-like protein kinase At2g23200 [Rutidosis leptorrhynchoides]|uniref:probable receptor-like protein kinase At2g23200 n=1 Tax=Rutidosis leptorrhynchoides TaxID=125765 RepID=UPI003A9A3426
MQVCIRAVVVTGWCIRTVAVCNRAVVFLIGSGQRTARTIGFWVGWDLALDLNQKKKNSEHLKIRLSDITFATDNFSDANRIGVTGSVNLYKAELEYFDKLNPSYVEGENEVGQPKRRNTVIVKRILASDDKKEGEIFFMELEMLTTCKHPNIVTLVGFCDEGSEMILVIEHASNGDLDDMYDSNNKHKKDGSVLTWAKRLKICLDIARGLKYLHYQMEGQKRIINCDIRSKNILLDENWGAKIANFEVSEFLPLNKDDDALHLDYVSGTPSYRDPEYEETHRLKRESDVYSFGLVLFEVLSGEVNKTSLDKFIKLAYKCIAETQDQCPTMNTVVHELEHMLLLQEEDQIFDEVQHKSPQTDRRHFSQTDCHVSRPTVDVAVILLTW